MLTSQCEHSVVRWQDVRTMTWIWFVKQPLICCQTHQTRPIEPLEWPTAISGNPQNILCPLYVPIKSISSLTICQRKSTNGGLIFKSSIQALLISVVVMCICTDLCVSGVLRIHVLKVVCFQLSSASRLIILSVLLRWGSPVTCFTPTVS